MAEPLSKEEREAIAAEQRVWPWCEQLDRYEATVQAAEERAERLRGAAIRAKAHLSDERSAAAHAAAAELLDALAADDAARGEAE